MQNLLNKKVEQEELNHHQKLTISDIEKFYLQGMKNTLSYGVEYERLALDKNTLKNANYERLAKIIEHFSKISNWKLIYDKKIIIGAKDDKGSSISLEPGMQLEISLAPSDNLFKIELEIKKTAELLDKIALIYDVIFLSYGMSPKSNVDEIKILEKQRYKIMNDYLPYCYYGELCPKMMHQSAGIQINVDYKNKKDAYDKLKFFNLIMPFTCAISANSPYESDRLTKYKTSRAHVWRYTGRSRCNLFYENIFSKRLLKYKNVFKNYINEIIDVPMIYIEREDKNIIIDGKITFREFMESGYQGYYAQYEDYILHQSLCFPDIRLKNYIEIRNHDSNSIEHVLALCALYKGLSQYDFSFLLKKFNYLKLDKIDYYFEQIETKGLDFKAEYFLDGWDIVTELINYSKKNLKTKERNYLKPLLDLIKKRTLNADIIDVNSFYSSSISQNSNKSSLMSSKNLEGLDKIIPEE